MHWVKIGKDYYDLSNAYHVMDRRELTAEEMALPESDPMGPSRPIPSVYVLWRDGSAATAFLGEEADEVIRHMERLRNELDGPADRPARD